MKYHYIVLNIIKERYFYMEKKVSVGEALCIRSTVADYGSEIFQLVGYNRDPTGICVNDEINKVLQNLISSSCILILFRLVAPQVTFVGSVPKNIKLFRNQMF